MALLYSMAEEVTNITGGVHHNFILKRARFNRRDQMKRKETSNHETVLNGRMIFIYGSHEQWKLIILGGGGGGGGGG